MKKIDRNIELERKMIEMFKSKNNELYALGRTLYENYVKSYRHYQNIKHLPEYEKISVFWQRELKYIARKIELKRRAG